MSTPSASMHVQGTSVDPAAAAVLLLQDDVGDGAIDWLSNENGTGAGDQKVSTNGEGGIGMRRDV